MKVSLHTEEWGRRETQHVYLEAQRVEPVTKCHKNQQEEICTNWRPF